MNPILLGVNIDHIATLRQARGGVRYPDPVYAAQIAQSAGADGITLHLREDRRHIQDRDVYVIHEILQAPMNFEMAVTTDMITLAEKILPAHCCFVPEKREELTTEGGLDVIAQLPKIRAATQKLQDLGIQVSLFIEADIAQIDAAVACGAQCIEIHTGTYAESKNHHTIQQELIKIKNAARYAKDAGLQVNAGHGLHYHNVQAIAQIPELTELNIGHSIIAEALFTGLTQAVSTMKQLMCEARMMCS